VSGLGAAHDAETLVRGPAAIGWIAVGMPGKKPYEAEEESMKRTLVVMLACVVAVGLVPSVMAADTVKLGMIGPISGPVSFQGASMKKAAELAVDEINKKGGVQGTRFELIVEDDESMPVKAVNAAEKLVTKDQVLAVVGHYNSSCTLASMAVTQKNKVPHLNPISTAADITGQGYKYIFRNCATNPMQVGQLADYVIANLKKPGKSNKVAIFYEHTDYGKGIMEIFRDKMKETQGFEVVAIEMYKPGDTDMIAQLTKIKATQPDFFLFGGNVTEVAQSVRQAKEIGLKTQFLALGGVSNDKFPELAGKENIEGMINVSYFETTAKNPLATDFINNYRSRYNADPDMYAAAVYEAFFILQHAVSKTGVKPANIAQWRDALRDALAGIKDLPGVQGPTTFGPDGQADKKIYIIRWENGKRVIIYPKGA
jgi:branched-chain amino acid transport system substrate-binding protein